MSQSRSQSSEWNIWDFHLHTPFSILNNGFGDPHEADTWEHYASQIVTKAQEKGIVALGLTDYFTIEGYKKALELKEADKLGNIFIFPNIEFRVDKIINSKRGENRGRRRLNLHVLISPEISTREIEEGFLHDLDFYYEQDPFSSSTTRKLKLHNLEKFGNLLKNQHSDFQSYSDIYVGCMNAVVKTEQIKEYLDNRFKGQYLIVLADEDLSEIDWNGQDHATRKQLVQMSHAIFSSNLGTRDFCLGNKHSSQEEFINEFKSLKPCLWGCDSHSYQERFLEPNDKRYCWIKSEVSWEGLKQVLYEPCERVRVQTENPETQKSSFTLKKLKIERSNLNKSLTINNLSVDLNPNLVTIIGGRGSGKTALLDIIASCFREGEKLRQIETSFINRLYNKQGTSNSSNSPINLSLVFQSGDYYEGEIGSNEFEPFQRSDILYLTQNHFEEYSANPKKLNEHIVDLVFNNFPEYRSDYENRKRNLETKEQEIQNINLNIEQLQKEVNDKEEDLKNKLNVKIGERDDIKLRLASMEKQENQSDTTIKDLTDKLEEFRANQKTLEETLLLLDKIETEIEKFNLFYKDNSHSLNEQLKLIADFNQFNELSIELKDLNIVKDDLIKNKQVLNQFKDSFQQKISEQKEKISALKGIEKQIAELRQKVASLKTEIQEIETQIQEIENKKNQIDELNSQRIKLYAEIIQMITTMKLFFQDIIDYFEQGKDEILNNLQFKAFVDMQKQSDYLQQIANKLDNRTYSQDELENSLSELFESMEKFFNTETESELNEASNGNSALSIAQNLESKAKELRLKSSVTQSDYFNCIFRRFFDLGVKISFNNKPINNLSMGERAIVLLKILLSLDEKPLLIDQPEEHLDNRFIFDELVPAFRSAKKKRQIIIATHNANLVVNTDAEQIIVAESSEGVINYDYGPIENIRIRNNITQLLEGGELAFKKREEKYGYKF